MKRRTFAMGAGGMLAASRVRPARAETALSFPSWQAEEAGFQPVLERADRRFRARAIRA